MTCAGLGVTGTIAGGQYLVDGVARSDNVAAGDTAATLGKASTSESGQGSAAAPASADPASAKAAESKTPDSAGEATPSSEPVPFLSRVDRGPAKPASGEVTLDRTAVERLRAAERADRASERVPVGTAQEMAYTMVVEYGWDESEFSCLVEMWDRESGWSHTASNPSSGAYGIPQALPGWKMASAGSDWETNPATQIKWGLGYISGRYGTPCGAWSFWQANHWY